MFDDHHMFIKTLGAGRADIIGRQSLQHRPARMAHQHTGYRIAQNKSRHDGGFQRLAEILKGADIARGGQPAQMHRKQKYQHDAEPEIGRGNPDKTHHIDNGIQQAAFIDRAQNTKADTQCQSNQHGHAGKLQGHRQFRGDQFKDRCFEAHGFTEIAMQHAFDPVKILQGQRLIEMILRTDLRNHDRIFILPRHDQSGIARQQMLQ